MKLFPVFHVNTTKETICILLRDIVAGVSVCFFLLVSKCPHFHSILVSSAGSNCVLFQPGLVHKLSKLFLVQKLRNCHLLPGCVLPLAVQLLSTQECYRDLHIRCPSDGGSHVFTGNYNVSMLPIYSHHQFIINNRQGDYRN